MLFDMRKRCGAREKAEKARKRIGEISKLGKQNINERGLRGGVDYGPGYVP